MNYLTPQEALAEFAADWEAAMRPDVDIAVRLVAPADEHAICDLIGCYLETAPTPPYSEVQVERLRVKTARVLARLPTL